MQTVANFSIQYRQYLSPSLTVTNPLPDFASNTDTLIELYRWMVLLRTFDAKAIALQRTGKMGTYASTLGQEAISVAIGHVMLPEDVLCPYYRDYGAQIQRGVKMSEILNYWGGDERGSDFQNNTQDLPICVPIASQCLHAAGVASAFKYRAQPRVAVTSIGEGGTSQGDFYEAMNLAGAWQLPVVFVVNNNQWAISVPRDQQTACQTIAQKAVAAGIYSEQVDGNDIIAVKQAIQEAVDSARNGDGPALIECITYRLCDHTTADDASRYRSDEELQAAWQEEPIKRLRDYLVAQQAWNEAMEMDLLELCKTQVAEAVAEYERYGDPMITDIFDHHFAECPTSLALQRQEAIEDAENA